MRTIGRHVVNWLVFQRGLLALPPRVGIFYWRARRLAHRIGDDATLVASTPPREVAALLRRARGHAQVVEIGTNAGWTAIALALNNPQSAVTTYDPFPSDTTSRYLDLAPSVRERITFIQSPGEHPAPEPANVGFLFIDANHDEESTIAAFSAWRDRITPGGTVVFHDFTSWPGVRSAVEKLGLRGKVIFTMFAWAPSPVVEAQRVTQS